jgi:hypothetical protein
MQRDREFVDIARKGGIDVLFIGDSITDFWRNRGKAVWDQCLAPLNAANFGIDGDRTQQVLWRIEHGELEGIKPKVIVLMIGTNNTGLEKDGITPRNTTSEVVARITAVVKELRTRLPDASNLLLAIFPRGPKGDPIRVQLNETNAAPRELGGGRHVIFLDIGPRFLTPDGTLTRESCLICCTPVKKATRFGLRPSKSHWHSYSGQRRDRVSGTATRRAFLSE